MRKLVLSLFAVLLCAFQLSAQRQQITGTVTGDDGAPVAGATVSVVGTTTGTSTDARGVYTINAPADATLEFSFLGLETLQVPVGNRTTINVTLGQSAEDIDPIIMVAYGTARKESFTGSAGVINEKQLKMRSVSNVTKALEGTVAGLQATSGSGQPGEGSDIRIRGFGSLNSSNAPLYVVDGAAYGGTLSSINPNDIASITVLKDAAAGALYGARGANGVILINTKRGINNDGKTRISVDAKAGVVSRGIPKYEMLNTPEYIEQNYLMYKNDLIYNQGYDPAVAGDMAITNMTTGSNRLFGSQQQYNPYNMDIKDLIDPVTGKIDPNAKLLWDQSWLDEAMRSAPVRQEYNISVSGGNQNTQYFSSVGYLKEDGIMKTTSFDRISARVSVDTKIRDWLKFSGGLSYSLTNSNYSSSTGSAVGNVWYSTTGIAPIFPVYVMDREGNYVLDENGDRQYDWSNDRPSGANPNFNPIGLLYLDKDETKNDNVGLNGTILMSFNDARYGWAEGIFLSTTISADIRNLRQSNYQNPNLGNASGEVGGRIYKYSTRNMDYTFNQIIGYNRTFGDHTIFGQVGHEYYDRNYNYLYAYKSGFPFGGLYEMNAATDNQDIRSYEHNYRIESVFAQLKYSYQDKYNFDASFRTDGSSRFHKDHRWGNFWSVGANWRISQEEFMRPLTWLNNLSLRASYGVQGNDALLDASGNVYYAWQAFYSLGTTLNNTTYNGSIVSSLANERISWEENANFNIGLESRLFNRLSLTVEYFSRKTKDMLLDVPMAPSTGFDSYNDNIGDMRNRGIEYDIAVDIFRNPNFTWRFTTLGTHYKNKILKLATDQPQITGNFIREKGATIYSYYLASSAGVDPATGQKLYWVWDTDESGNRTSDKYISSDRTKAAACRENVGSAIPHLTGSFGSQFTIYRNIDFSFLFSYQLGGLAYDYMYLSYLQPTYPGGNMHKHILRAWKEPGDVTDIPMAQYSGNTQLTGDELIKRTHLAIKNITLGYTFDGRLAERMGIESFRVFVTGENLHTFTKLKGFNPTSSFSSASTFTYVPTRSISLGVNLNF